MQNELKPCLFCGGSADLVAALREIAKPTHAYRGRQFAWAQDVAREAIKAWNARPTPQPVAGLVEEFTATIKFAAHEWWRRQGMSGTAEEVEIGRDGRVTVRWKDADESGRYGLPVDFLQALTAPAPDVTDAMVEAQQ